MVKLIKKWLGITELEEVIKDVRDDVLTTHNEYTDLYDTSKTQYELLQKQLEELNKATEELRITIEILRDGDIATRAQVIDEWFNGKEADING